MAKDPAFLFYSSDFIVGTYGMTNEQVGMYIKLMCLQHQKGHIPEALIMDVTHGDEAVLLKFVKDDNGCYYNLRLEDEIDKRRKRTEERLSNFTKCKKAMRDAHMDDHMQSHMGDHMEAHSENENENENVNGTKPRRKAITYDDPAFARFWTAYPNKNAKAGALKAFAKIGPDDALLNKMLIAIERAKATPQWQDNGGRYIPMPTTWLNGQRWEDEIAQVPQQQPDRRIRQVISD